MIDPQPKGSHFIDGTHVEDGNGAEIPVIYPASGARIATVYAATDAVVEQALASATRAQAEWAALSGTERGRVLRRAADIMRDRNRDLSELETRDTGKPLQETLVADATSGADALEYFGGLTGSLTGDHIPLGADFAYTRREPLGVCVGLGAWNYPTQIACWKAAPALACGNAMIFKPSETTPLSALQVAEILHEAGLPPGVFNVVQGRARVGSLLVNDARVAKVSLTGSVPTGRKVYAMAAVGMKHVTMELGGKSPLVIFDDADLENAVSGAIMANFYSSGQICSNGTRVFVQDGLHDALVARLCERLGDITPGDPLDPATTMGPLVTRQDQERVLALVDQGRSEGAELVFGGGVPEALERGAYVEPTLFTGVNNRMTIARQEIFGPVASVIPFDDVDEAIAIANDTIYGLAAGIWTRDLKTAHRFIREFEAGMVWVNTYDDQDMTQPFGGYKQSGNARDKCFESLLEYTQMKSAWISLA